MFVIFGCATSVFGILMFLFLADSPINAKWLTDEERHLAVERLRGNQQGLGSKVFKWYQIRETFTDIRVSISYHHILDSIANTCLVDIPNFLVHGKVFS